MRLSTILPVAVVTVTLSRVVGMSENVTRSDNGTARVWHIVEPNVQQRETSYPPITFNSGDRVRVEADGCAQTGGSGKTWKRYVDPQGPNSDHLYHGLIAVPGATPGMIRIQNVNGQTLTVEPTSDQNYLKLGYEDDGYDDNGIGDTMTVRAINAAGLEALMSF
jgi:hypothetical protein